MYCLRPGLAPVSVLIVPSSLAASGHSVIDVPGEESDFAFLAYHSISGTIYIMQWDPEIKLPENTSSIVDDASHESHLSLVSLSQRLKPENGSTLSLSYESNDVWYEVYLNFTSYFSGELPRRLTNQPLMATGAD